ncbi:hypothetical protein PCASD_08198 [Puccinia coronata f. sp. avenae]|uniref:Uncharacterized protein n=1 Tax=Puccinia coronata f. sp. avenae TaxID=200324 RepID=A0A2N5VC50_9BASI|nr:hypothetical protein PCASD_08198 [Puccinia coronata f. sp. avenae]
MQPTQQAAYLPGIPPWQTAACLLRSTLQVATCLLGSSLAGSYLPAKDSLAGIYLPAKDSSAGSYLPAEDSLAGSYLPAKDSLPGSYLPAKDSLAGSACQGVPQQAGSYLVPQKGGSLLDLPSCLPEKEPSLEGSCLAAYQGGLHSSPPQQAESYMTSKVEFLKGSYWPFKEDSLAGIYLLGKEDFHVPGKEESLAGSYLRGKENSSLSAGKYIPEWQGLLHGKQPPNFKTN